MSPVFLSGCVTNVRSVRFSTIRKDGSAAQEIINTIKKRDRSTTAAEAFLRF
jgi:hypothetical protein